MITEPRWKSYIVETTQPIFTPKQCQMIIEAGRSEPKQDAQVGNSMRHLRNELLEETDWNAMSDVTMADDMKTYRQALRDLPTHKNWPNLEDADWPTKP